MIKKIHFIVICHLFFIICLKAESISILPLALKISVPPDQKKRAFFRIYNKTVYTQNVTAYIHDWKNGDESNVPWIQWCSIKTNQIQLEPLAYEDFNLFILVPKKLMKKNIKKLMAMCFFQSELKNNKKKKDPFMIKIRKGHALYVHVKE